MDEKIIDEAIRKAMIKERAACLAEVMKKAEYDVPMPCPDGIPGCEVYHFVKWERPRTLHEIVEAICKRGPVE